jgi:hypothetical protein
MHRYTVPFVLCSLCRKPLNLRFDLSCDENGKAVHTDCYIKRVRGTPLIVDSLLHRTQLAA